jgi:hypothetical protein
LRSRLGFFSWEALKEYVIASSLNSSLSNGSRLGGVFQEIDQRLSRCGSAVGCRVLSAG